jgi:hypothetical protein
VTESQPHATPHSHLLIAHAALATVVLVLFGPVLWHPFIAFDDAELILRNPQVTDPLAAPLDLFFTPRVGYVVPVTVALEAGLFALAHGKAWAFHAAALALHALFASQLLVFGRQLGLRLAPAFAAALVFAVHPLVVQPVAWAICLKDLLMANFALGATRAFLRAGEGTAVRGNRATLAVILASLAMLSKPTATLIGFAWLAYLIARRAGAPSPRTSLLAAVLTAGLGAIVGFASRFSHDVFLGANGEASWTPLGPWIVLGRHLTHVLWPHDLLVLYPDPAVDPAPLVAAGLGALGALCIAVCAWRVRRTPGAVLVLALALAIYLPTSGVLPFARVMSDSYMYLPLACICIGAAWAAMRALRATSPNLERTVAFAAAGLVLALAAGSHAQLPRWSGGTALWQPVVNAHPRLAMAHRLMGDELVFRDQPARAANAYRHAFALEYDARYLLEFGTVLGMAGRIADAECVLIEACAYGPDHGYAVFNYAALLAFHSEYAPRYPAIAAQLLHEVDALRRSKKIAWPVALEPGLLEQLDRVGGRAGQPQAWPQRNCPVLAAR